MKNKILLTIITTGVFLLAAFFRFYGVNWDQGQHLHPDERFLTMVANGISWPKNIWEYLDTSTSPLNPHNRGYGFFVYGTFPVFLTKWVAESLGKGDYGNLTLIGRQLSALFDLGTVILVFLIGKQIIANQLINQSTNQQVKRNQNKNIGLLAAFFYAVSVLPIQLSHFYAVDTYLSFFSTLNIYLIIRLILKEKKKITHFIPLLFLSLGISFGLSIASKISGVLAIPTIVTGLIFYLLYSIKNKRFHSLIFGLSLFIFSSYLTVRLTQPYAFADGNIFALNLNPKFIQNMKELKGMDDPKAMFPPAIQWRNRTVYLFPLISIINAGMGLSLALVSIFAFIYALFKTIHFAVNNILIRNKIRDYLPNEIIITALLIIMILTVFIYQGGLYTMNMRYFIGIYPALCVLSGYFIFNLFQNNYVRHNFILKVFLLVILASTLIWPISFFAIYQKPHSRVIASEWIYEHIPSGSTLTYEIWDDPLPLHLPEKTPERYKFVEMPMYDPDVPIKWQKVVNSLEEADYIIMSSNRLWGSIPRVPNIYPLASEYYQALFDGSLGFEEVADITSSLCFPTANYCLFQIDDSLFAEESFTVYDHPEILIYKKNKLNETLLREWLEKSQEVKS